jgi:hypothetical protein
VVTAVAVAPVSTPAISGTEGLPELERLEIALSIQSGLLVFMVIAARKLRHVRVAHVLQVLVNSNF